MRIDDATRQRLHDVVASALVEAGLEHDSPHTGAFAVTLPGEHKLQTLCWLVVGQEAVLVEAFVMRRPDENHDRLHEYLLHRNRRMYGVAFCLDRVGDVYLVGRFGPDAVTADEVDRWLGSVLEYADGWFDAMVQIGFATSIRKEWEWRTSRGESTRNLQAYARFAEPPPGAQGRDPVPAADAPGDGGA